MVIMHDAKKIKKVEQEIGLLFNQFDVWLWNKGLDESEVGLYLLELSNYADFLVHEGIFKVSEGWQEIDKYFRSGFVRDFYFTNEVDFNDAIIYIIQFYAFLNLKKKIPKDDLDCLNKIICKNKPDWLEILKKEWELAENNFNYDDDYDLDYDLDDDLEDYDEDRLSDNFYYDLPKGIIDILCYLTDSDNEEDHMDFLDELMISDYGLVPERNDVCYCGSGKKYKKCCLKRDQNGEDEELLTGRYDVSFKIVNKLTIDDDLELLVDEDYKTFMNCCNNVMNDDHYLDNVTEGDVLVLKELCKKYPTQPEPVELLFCICFLKDELLKNCLEEIVQKTPDNVLARLCLVNFYFLIEGNIEKAKNLLGDKISLHEFYTYRKEFYVSEYIALDIALINLCLTKGNILLAQKLLEPVMDLAERFDRPGGNLLSETWQAVMIAKISRQLTLLIRKK